MLKNIFRQLSINLLSLYAVSRVVSGFTIPLSLETFLKATLIFTLLNFLGKPLLKIIFLPINFLTLGLFGWFINVIILYLLVVLLPEIHLRPTNFAGFSWQGIILPEVNLNTLGTAILVSFLLSFLSRLFSWLMER